MIDSLTKTCTKIQHVTELASALPPVMYEMRFLLYEMKLKMISEPIFLTRFFRNLLMGEQNELKNRYLLVNPPEEWKMSANTTQVPEQVRKKTMKNYFK